MEPTTFVLASGGLSLSIECWNGVSSSGWGKRRDVCLVSHLLAATSLSLSLVPSSFTRLPRDRDPCRQRRMTFPPAPNLST